MKFVATIWEWFNGNKTQIGGLLIAIVASGFVPEGIIYDVMAWAGGILAGAGVAHKVIKGVDNT